MLAVAALAERLDRADLGQRLRIAVSRMLRPATVVCVVGEFKQGKSSLVNGLIAAEACPVDDDLATSAVTLVRHGAAVRVEVRRREGEQAVAEEVPLGSLRDWVTESGNPDNKLAVERVEISVPAPLLESGLVLVDTPGMGNLGAGHAAATLAFLPFADGLVFATDASAELSGPEADFLQRAAGLCPTVLVALTKTDLHPRWHEIAELDRGHLRGLGSDAELVPVSSSLRTAALDREDAELDALSGFPDLQGRIEAGIVAPAKARAARRAVQEALVVLEQLGGVARAELALLDDPAQARQALEGLEAANARLEHLKGPGAHWSTLVADRLADLNNDTTFRLRASMRSVTRTVEDRIELLKTPKDWEELSRELQALVADAVTEVFQGIEHATASIREEVVELLAEESIDLPALPTRTGAADLAGLWSAKDIDPKTGKVSTGLTGLRGAQSGILMFGMMAQFLPVGVGAFLALTPVALAIGAAFAGVQLADAQKRKVQLRRQAARQTLRQFVDDVQFEVGNEVGEALRQVQRGIRDEFGQRVAELQSTYAHLAAQGREALARDEASGTARRAVLEAVVSEVDALAGLLSAQAEP